MFSALAGLMVIYSIKLFGIDALIHNGVARAGAITGTAMAWYAIFNGLGRIAWGSVSDRIGGRRALDGAVRDCRHSLLHRGAHHGPHGAA